MLTRSEVQTTIKRYKLSIESLFESAEITVSLALATNDPKEINNHILVLKRQYDCFFYYKHKKYKAKFDEYHIKNLLTPEDTAEIINAINKHCTEYSKYALRLEKRIDKLTQKNYSCFRLFFHEIFCMESCKPKQKHHPKFQHN